MQPNGIALQRFDIQMDAVKAATGLPNFAKHICVKIDPLAGFVRQVFEFDYEVRTLELLEASHRARHLIGRKRYLDHRSTDGLLVRTVRFRSIDLDPF